MEHWHFFKCASGHIFGLDDRTIENYSEEYLETKVMCPICGILNIIEQWEGYIAQL